jgi:hypothetical protein
MDNLDDIKQWYIDRFGPEEIQQESSETIKSRSAEEADDDEGSETSESHEVCGIFTEPSTQLHPAEKMKFYFMNYRGNSCSRAIKSVMRRLVTVSLNCNICGCPVFS